MVKKRIVLAGGGSAGHVNPLLATATELRKRGYDTLVLGTEEGLEADLVPAKGFDLVTIPKVPLPRRPSPAIFSLPGRLRKAFQLAKAEIVSADAVVGFGGYVSVPAYLAARRLEVPVVIHEQNVRPGLANRLGARFAAVVALTFRATKLRAKRGTTKVTGLPLRAPIATLALARQDDEVRRRTREEAAATFGLDPARPILLITGGSLGALHLNEVMTEAAGSLPPDAQVLHLTGKGKDATVRTIVAARGLSDRWIVVDYSEQMEQALAAADLVVCRSGAGTVAELSALGLPAVFVPLPIGNGEQSLNATGVVEAGGAFLVDNKNFDPDTVRDLVYPTLQNKELLDRMGKAARSAMVGNGTGALTDLVEMICNDGK